MYVEGESTRAGRADAPENNDGNQATAVYVLTDAEMRDVHAAIEDLIEDTKTPAADDKIAPATPAWDDTPFVGVPVHA